MARSFILRGATHFRIATDIVARIPQGSYPHVTARDYRWGRTAFGSGTASHLSEKRQKIATMGITKIAIQNKLLIDQSVN